jgi:transcriptional regulator with XRE-family HTH domain
MSYHNTTYSNLGNKIKSIRKELCLTQKYVAEGIVTRNMLSRIENGYVTPSLETLTKIADRLEIPVGYLIDDNDDGTKLKNERLLSMIKDEFYKENYDLCLQYLANLEYFPEDKNRLVSCSELLLGIKKAYDDSRLKDAHALISSALKNDQYLTSKMISDGICLRALIDGFSYNNSAGSEEDVIIDTLKFAKSSSDLAILAGILNLLKSSDSFCAQQMLNNSIIENHSICSLISGRILIERNELKPALSKLIEALSGYLPSPLKCYCLTLLEKICAESKDYEKAYGYMTMRKELLQKLF